MYNRLLAAALAVAITTTLFTGTLQASPYDVYAAATTTEGE